VVKTFADFEFDDRRRSLKARGQSVRLSGQALDLLCLLLERPGDLITRNEIERALWPDTNVISDHSLDVVVSRLRMVLGDKGPSPRYIETVPRRGYRFIEPVIGRPEARPGTAPRHWRRRLVTYAIVAILAAIAAIIFARTRYDKFVPAKRSQASPLAVLEQPVLARAASQTDAAWRDPSPHQVRWVTVDSSIRLEVLDWQGSGPPLVLLGCYLSAHSYDEFAPQLANQFHVYGVTRRGIGRSDKPATGYAVQRSVDDLLEVLDSLNAQKSLLVGTSCAGQVLTMFASHHSDRLSGLVYLDGATDPTTPPFDPPLPDPGTLPRPLRPVPEADRSSFSAFTKRPNLNVTFPEAEWRQQFAENPDGSVGQSLMDPVIRKAITVDARVKPNYAGIRVPVLAIYQAQPPFEQVAADYDIRNEQERAALRQQYTAVRVMYTRWQQDLLAAIPTARIVELPGANLYMFQSNTADVLREIRAFTAGLAR